MPGDAPAPNPTPSGDDAAIGKGGFNWERCCDVVEGFIGLQGGECEVQRILNLCPAIRGLLAGRKVVAFLEQFPEKFALDRGRDKIVVKLLDPEVAKRGREGLSEEVKAYLKFEQDDHYTDELLRALVKGVETFTSRQGGEYAPMRWLFAHRSIPKYLKSYAHTHPNPAWQYHLQPDFGGFGGEGRAKTAAGLEYLRHFISTHTPRIFEWEPRPEGEGTAGVKERLKLAAGHEGHMPQGPRPSEHVKTKHDHGALSLMSANAKRKFDAATPALPGDVGGSADATMPASGGTGPAPPPGPGDTLLVTRVSTRTKDVNRLELMLMTEWCGLEGPAPAEVRAGLYTIKAPQAVAAQTQTQQPAATDPYRAWGGLAALPPGMQSFLQHLPLLTSLRRCGRVICATDDFDLAPTPRYDVFIAAVASAIQAHPRYADPATTFHVDCDTHYPEAHNRTLPFYDMTAHADLLFKIYAAIGIERVCGDAASASVSLVVVAVKDLLVLAEQATCALSGAVEWHAMWEQRPFIFSGTMEPNVGLSVASACRMAHAVDAKQQRTRTAVDGGRKQQRAEDGSAVARPTTPLETDLHPEVVLDACCGSGTLAAAMRHLGAKRVYGFELREDFTARVPQNFVHAGFNDDVFVLCQDCTKPLPDTSTLPAPTLVTCNAPWGKKFGVEKDCEKVVRGVLANYPNATVCFVIPRATLDVVRRDLPGLRVLHSVAIGTISLIIVRQAP